jgi:NADH dehydrogenase
LGEELGQYTERKLRDRRVEVVKGVRVANYNGSIVNLTDSQSLAASTLIWTAGVKPSPVIALLPYEKEHGRVRVNEYLAVPLNDGIWAVGDCAAVPDPHSSGGFYPPTAQHGMREGLLAATNIERAILARPLKPFRYRTMGLLASIGHRTGVAKMFGIKFSGFIAWWLWRMIYLAKLPGLAKKLRVTVAWTIDTLFGRDLEQMITLRDVEALSDWLTRYRRIAHKEL